MAKLSQTYQPNAEHTDAAPGGGLPLRDLLAILRRRRRVVLWSTAVMTTVAVLLGLQVTKTYSATAQVMVEPREKRILEAETVAPGLPAEDSAIIETHIKLIQSWATLARAVDNLDLASDPRFSPGRAADRQSVGGPAGLLASWLPDWIIDQLPWRWAMAAGVTPGGAQGLDPELLRERAINALQGHLKVAQSGRSYVLSINYTSTRPQEAVRIANGIAAAYIEVQLGEKLSATRRASAWLGEQVEQLRWKVFGSELAMEEFRESHGIAVRGPALDSQQLAVLTSSMIDARAERSAKEDRLRSLRAMRDSGRGLESSAEILSSPLIVNLGARELELSREEAQLSREYGGRHPVILELRAEQQKLADRIDDEIDNVIANLENDLALARSREAAHAEHLREARGVSAVTGQAEVQLRELEREVAASRSLYETLLVRLKETEQQQEIVQADARLISPAQLPVAPSSASPMLFAMVGFTGSLVLGSLLALLLERLDNTLRTSRQVEELLGLPSLGLVPRLAVRAEACVHDHMIEQPQSAYAEAVHALHTQVCLADRDRPPPSAILVTSALPGEGKTSLAASLAVFARQLGHTTLLVDLDLRRPAVAREFKLAPRADLLAVLAGSVTLEDAVVQDPDSGVDLLAASDDHGNPITLLTSERLMTVLREARERYDYVIIDTPPVLGLPDVKALSPAADAIVFVVQWDRTRRDAAAAALKQLADVSAEVAGVVLNQVDMKKHASYGYGDAAQYYLEYSKCYTR